MTRGGKETEMMGDVMRETARAWRSGPGHELTDELRDAVGKRIQTELRAMPRSERPSRGSPGRLALIALPLAAAAAIAVVLALPDAPAVPTTGEKRATGAAQKQAPGRESARLGARLARITGRATLLKEGSPPSPVTQETRFGVGDTISLGPRSLLELELTCRGRVVLGSRAVVSLGGDVDAVALELKRGVVAAKIEKRAPGQRFSVNTPAGVVEVTGTSFQVEVLTTAEAFVRVVEGTVNVRDLADDRNVVAVAEGQDLAVDWNDPVVRVLDDEARSRVLAMFAGEITEEPDGGAAKTATRALPDPGRWEKLFDEAASLRKQRRFGEALEVYERIARGARSRRIRAEAWFTIGQLRFTSGDSAGAEQVLSHHMKLFTGTPYEKMAQHYLSSARARLGGLDR